MIEIGKVNARCLDYKDIVNLEVVLRNIKETYNLQKYALSMIYLHRI